MTFSVIVLIFFFNISGQAIHLLPIKIGCVPLNSSYGGEYLFFKKSYEALITRRNKLYLQKINLVNCDGQCPGLLKEPSDWWEVVTWSSVQKNTHKINSTSTTKPKCFKITVQKAFLLKYSSWEEPVKGDFLFSLIESVSLIIMLWSLKKPPTTIFQFTHFYLLFST